MKKTLLSLLAIAFVTINAGAAGTESFENAPDQKTEVGTYTYTGDNGQKWTIVGTTDGYISGYVGATLYAYATQGCSITGAFSTEQMAEGVGTVSFRVKAAAAGSAGWGQRTFTIAVDAVSVQATANIPNASTIVTVSADINLTAAQLTSSSQLKITMQGVASDEPGFVVDDLAWTSYSGKTDTPTMTVDAYQDQNTKIYWGSDVRAYFASTTPDATFYYTLDGAQPTQTSAKYTSEGVALPLDATTTVKILAVTEAKGESEVATYTVTTAAGIVEAATGTAVKPNERWETTGSVSTTKSDYTTTSTSGAPYIYLSSKGASIITEDYLSPQAFSVYVGARADITLKVYFQTGNFKLVDGAYVWQPATADWIALGTFTSKTKGAMLRTDFTLPDSIKNRRVRFKLYSQNAANIDDITTVIRAAEATDVPTFSQPGGDVAQGTKITVQCPTGATLHYRTNDGAWQTSTSDVELTINQKTTVTAYASHADKYDSYLVEATYQLPTTKSPEFSIASGSTLYQGDKITISSATDGANIVYSINGGDVQTVATPASITVEGKIDSITAYCTATGLLNSDVITARYTTAQVQTPTTNATSTTVLQGDKILVYSPTDATTLHYCIDDGAWKTATNSAYITIETSCTLYAYATKDNYLQSDMLTQHYTVARGQLPTPTADIPSGTLLTAGAKVIVAIQSGATLHYRINNGTWQTVDGQENYTFTINENSTIEAYLSQQDYVDSETATLVYRIARGKVATPYVSSTDERAVAINTSITIVSATEGATLYYDIDHSGKWLNGYSKITYIIDQVVTIRAYAVCDDYFDSDTLEVSFTIKSTPTAVAAEQYEVAVYAEPLHIVVEGAAHADVAIYTALGTLVAQQPATADRMSVPVPTAGLYLVRIGNNLYKTIVRTR